jgi:hypothetical protein
MISVESLLYKLDMKLNKVAALEHQVIPLENKILSLNEAQLKMIKVKMDFNNPLGLGLDSFKKRYEDLETIIEDAADHPLTLSLTDPRINEWSADLDLLVPNYMFFVDSYIVANKGECLNKVIYVNRGLTKHADVLTLLVNTSYRPSFEYEETFSTIAGQIYHIYTDGTFTPTTAYISYVRYPAYIDYPGYVHFDGTVSIHTDCELHNYLEDELLNYAVEELAMDTENTPAAQYTQERIRTSE